MLSKSACLDVEVCPSGLFFPGSSSLGDGVYDKVLARSKYWPPKRLIDMQTPGSVEGEAVYLVDRNGIGLIIVVLVA